jgi:hypothetical protein
MATSTFVKISEYAGKMLEKGMGSAIKFDCRWQDYGADLKKNTPADNVCVGPVAFAVLTDPKNEDPVLARRGTVTRMMFHCGATGERYVMLDTIENEDAVAYAKSFVDGVYVAVNPATFSPETINQLEPKSA